MHDKRELGPASPSRWMGAPLCRGIRPFCSYMPAPHAQLLLESSSPPFPHICPPPPFRSYRLNGPEFYITVEGGHRFMYSRWVVITTLCFPHFLRLYHTGVSPHSETVQASSVSSLSPL